MAQGDRKRPAPSAHAVLKIPDGQYSRDILAFLPARNSMPQLLPDGLYDQLLTDDLVAELGHSFQHDHYTLKDLDAGSGARRLAEALSEQLASILQDIAPHEAGDAGAEGKTSRLQAQLEFVNAMLSSHPKFIVNSLPKPFIRD